MYRRLIALLVLVALLGSPQSFAQQPQPLNSTSVSLTDQPNADLVPTVIRTWDGPSGLL